MPSRRRKRAAIAVGGAAAGAAVATRGRRPRWATTEDPCGPDGVALPDGDRTTVTTDDGAELSVLVAGPVEGPTVVLPHCWMGSMAIWAPVARRLVADGHRVVLYDQRGHGGSSLGRATLTTDRLGHDLATVITAIDARDVVLGGHSMGGMTIQAFAATDPALFRSVVRGVALVSTSAHNGGLRVPPRVAHAVLGERRTASLQKRKPWSVRRAVGRDAHRLHLHATHEALVATTSAARAGFLVAMSRMDYRPALATIGVPTVVLVGTRDRLTPPARAKVLADRIPGARLEVLSGFGHMLPLEAPQRVAEEIAALVPAAAAASG
jgi:non-heme chloroperoxidase